MGFAFERDDTPFFITEPYALLETHLHQTSNVNNISLTSILTRYQFAYNLDNMGGFSITKNFNIDIRLNLFPFYNQNTEGL